MTFVCFESHSVLDRQMAPALQGRLRKLLSESVTSALLSNGTAEETPALVKMLTRSLESNSAYAREKARSLLQAILVNHLSAVESAELAVHSSGIENIQKLLPWLNRHLSEEINIEIAASKSHMSRSAFTRYFKKYTKQSFSNYVTNARLKLAADLLLKEQLSVTEVAFRSGYRNLGHFYGQFQKYYGITPSQYRKVSFEMIPSNSTA